MPKVRLSFISSAALIFLVGSALRVVVLGLVGRANEEKLTDLLTSWDAKYYLDIARDGYFNSATNTDVPVHERTLAFFPGFPMLLRALHQVTGLDLFFLALLLNSVAGVALTAGAMAIARRMGANWAHQLGAGVLASGAPMSTTFTMPYTEALFGALAFWALVALMDRRWWLASSLIFLCGFTRLTAVALVGAFLVVVLLKARADKKAWVALLLSPWSFVGYLLWASWHTRDAGGYFGIQQDGWNSTFDGGVATATWVYQVLTSSTDGGYLLTAAVIIAAVVFLALSWRRLPLEVWVFSATLMATVVLSDGIMHSRPRLLLPAVLVLLPWVERIPPRWLPGAAAAWLLWGAWFSAYMLGVFAWAI
ncbi:Mannosyltransferase (PIG-V) [Corynebacterium atrinae]|uniref:hypothetical protein n=1 Tax=Corynebacterium atrinae TaxID=1336740 RepID=UPI0025B404F3|nr:hypothetical protein [Corynebacterium atrinae]WJY62329.1 Mannosyltransferase (PIG-V) [Corynebacterium atrinae]